MRRLREWLAYRIAPWVYVHYREAREEAFRDLAEIAYGSRDAIWTSPRVLVSVAIRESRQQAAKATGEAPQADGERGA